MTAYVGALVVADMAFSTTLTPLLPHYGLPKATAGVLMGAYSLGAVLGAVPGGVLAARAGPRAAVLLGLATAAAAALTMGWCSLVTTLAAARFVQGLAGSASRRAGWHGLPRPRNPPAAVRCWARAHARA